MLQTAIIEEAMDWIDTPYSNYKRMKGVKGGVDCLNYVAGVFQNLDVLGTVKPRRYDRKFWLRKKDLMFEGVLEGLSQMKPGHVGHIFHATHTEWMPGDMLLVKTMPRMEFPNHTVFVQDASGPQVWIIHADGVRGKVRKDVLPTNWEPSHIVRVREAA